MNFLKRMITISTPLFLLAACGTEEIAEEPVSTSAFVNLMADVNRDGYVDASDNEQAEEVSAGLIVLPNLDDDAQRCDQYITLVDGIVLETEDFIQCNDAQDDVANGPEDIADLSLVQLQINGQFSANASLTLTIVDAQNQPLDAPFHLMIKQDDQFYDYSNQRPTFAELSAGAELAIEARDIIRDPQWDGSAQLVAQLNDGEISLSDSIPLKLAPLISQHELGTARTIITSPSGYDDQLDTSDPELAQYSFAQVAARFIDDLGAASAGKIEQLQTLDDVQGDIWAQDYFEQAFVSKPSPGGAQQLRIMLRSANSSYGLPDFSVLPQFENMSREEIYAQLNTLSDAQYFALVDRANSQGGANFRNAGAALYSELRGPDIGVVQMQKTYIATQAGVNDSFNSTGNFTAAPPSGLNDGLYPLGRMIYGSTPNPRFVSLLEAQGLASPVQLNTRWLYVGHVDEFMTFLPSTVNPRGWVLAVADPQAALDVLIEAAQASVNTVFDDAQSLLINNNGGFGQSSASLYSHQRSIDDVLNDDRVIAANQLAITSIEEDLVRLKQELGLTDSDIIRLPVMYTIDDTLGVSSFDLSVGNFAVSALFPNAVNGVYLGDYEFISPKQYGPIVNGEDLLQNAVEQKLSEHGLSVSWVDDFNYAHLGLGNVHCVTNTLRDTDDVNQWWLN